MERAGGHLPWAIVFPHPEELLEASLTGGSLCRSLHDHRGGKADSYLGRSGDRWIESSEST